MRTPALYLIAIALATYPVLLQGQSLPAGMTPEQAATLLQQNPAMGPSIMAQLQASGLSQAEIRARLQAAGYPAGALDQYLGDSIGSAGLPGTQTVRGSQGLGLTTFSHQDSVTLGGDSAAVRHLRDSLRIDSVLRAELYDRANPRLKVFGLDAFRRATSVFVPLAAGPVDQNYRLGPGDGITLIITGETEVAYAIDVSREGKIFIPDVGEIFVNNLSVDQLREVLFTRLARVYSGISRRPDARSRFAVEVTKVRTIAVRVAGEVARPGTYQVGATGGVLSALYEAGGPTDRGNFRAVRVQRGADSVGSVDLYRYLLTGITPTEVRLDAGDVVFVPTRGTQVKVAGEVVRPAIYELNAGEGLRDLIRIAGGLTPQAAISNVSIVRILPPEQRIGTGRERTVVTVDLGTALEPARPAVPLFPDDSVTIFSIRGARTMSVSVGGSVWQPGTYRLSAGMRLWDLIRMAGGLRPETYAGRAQILHSLPDSTRVMAGVVLDSLAPNNNPALAELDNVTIYPKTDFRPDRYIAVYGSVRKPGLIAFSDSMTLRDAVLLAGGTTEDAYLAQAELSRVRVDGSTVGDSTAVALRVPLDSTFATDPTGYLKRSVGMSNAPVVPLEPYDNIYIRRQPGLESQRTVTLSGEVRFPGRYTLLSKDERLSDLITRAGGLTSRAYSNGVRFYRRPFQHTKGAGLVSPPESEQLEPRPQAGSLPPEQTVTATRSNASGTSNASSGTTGMARLGVDLNRVLREPRYKDNLTLNTGDSIYIPAFIPVVLVEGGVNAPKAITYVPGADRGYYINAAGGYTGNADKKRAFIEQPNGHIERDGKPAAGAVVVVPVRDPSLPNPVNLVTVLGVVAQLLSAATAIVVVLASRL